MAISVNHQTNEIASTSGSLTVTGATVDITAALTGNKVDVTASSGTYTLDLSAGNYFFLNGPITSNVTIALSNAPSTQSMFFVIDSEYLAGTITFPADFYFSGGAFGAPAAGERLFVVVSKEAGAAYYVAAVVSAVPNDVVYTSTFLGSASSSATNGGEITVDLSGLSLQEDDLVLAVWTQASNGGTIGTMSTSGYTSIATVSASDTYDTELAASYKFMGATPDTDFVIGNTDDASASNTAVAYVFRNVDTTTPLDVAATTGSATNTVIPPQVAITPTSSYCAIVVCAGGAHTGGVQTYSSSDLTDFVSLGSNDTEDSTIGVGYYQQFSAAAYTPTALTFSGSTSTAFSAAAITIALRPA